MKKNILFTGFDERLAADAAERFALACGMYYLSLREMCCYHACRKDVRTILNEEGAEGVRKYYKKAINDLADYEGTVASADFDVMETEWISEIIECSVVIFLGLSADSLSKNGITGVGKTVAFSRQRYYNSYDIYIKCDKKDADTIVGEAFAAVEAFFGGGH